MAYVPNSNSVVAFQGNPSVLQVLATVTNPTTFSSVSGTVGASVIGTVPTTQAGTWITSLVSTVPSSVLVGASIFGQLPAGTAVLGSVAALQGTNPWNIAGSVVSFQGGQHSTSITGTITVGAFTSAASIFGNASVFQSGTWKVSVAGVVDVAGSVAATQQGTWQVSVLSQVSATSSIYAVLSSITSVSILSANTSRRGATIYNAAGTNVFVKLGTAATTSVYTVLMNPSDYYELPFGWTGVVAGITASNAGIINVTELT